MSKNIPRPFPNPVDVSGQPRSDRSSLCRVRSKINATSRRTFPLRLRERAPIILLVLGESIHRPISRAFVSPTRRVWARRISRARRSAMGAGAVVVRSGTGSGWLSGDRWVVAGVAVLAAAAVGLGTALSLRLRGAGPCPPSRGHTTGAGRRVRGAGADADAAGPGPRRSIPSPAAF